MPDITVHVNGEEIKMPEGASLTELLAQRGMEINTAAVWINGVQPPCADYPSTTLRHGDEIKLYPISIGG